MHVCRESYGPEAKEAQCFGGKIWTDEHSMGVGRDVQRGIFPLDFRHSLLNMLIILVLALNDYEINQDDHK